VRQGVLRVTWPDGTVSRFAGADGPHVAVALRHWAAARRLAANPGLAMGECYMDGTLEPLGCAMRDVLDLVLLNLFGAGGGHTLLDMHQRVLDATRRLRQVNDGGRARRHVAHHYDLDARLYRLFLDEDLQYSCAYFVQDDDTLEQAQLAKKRLVAAKLHLHRPGMTVLDIGCGWGGLALHLARAHGARVTGITLSVEQLAVARARAAAEGLEGRVTFELADYRAMSTRFDRVVSVGMMEHVGLGNFGAFFGTVRRCLGDDGVALIHHIGRSAGPGATAAWLERYIFPGGYAPALSEVLPAIERSGLLLCDVETLRLHYARTVRHWAARFAANRAAIAALYDERFCRMFEFYLAAAELAFTRERQVVFQLQLSPSQTALPPTRGYLASYGNQAWE
jgi:cyclopropane-fatty-acyl-phospholipid synthase